MSGPTSLRSNKATLTRHCNNLKRLADECKSLEEIPLSSLQNPETNQKMHSSVFALITTAKLVENALAVFVASVDSLGDALTQEQHDQAQEHVDKAHTILDVAQILATTLEAALVGAQNAPKIDPQTSNANDSPTMHIGASKPMLPAIPVPTFSGKVWEFDNFWTLFEANIHSQPLPPLIKFNYLMNALRGEARDCLRRFNVTADNYTHAVSALCAKYGNESRLIDSLQSRLESARAEKPTIEEQRSLLECILPTVTQLEQKGVSLNGSFITQKVLSKFRPDIQRKVLERRLTGSSNENTWVMRELLADLEKVIETEERINYMMQKTNKSNQIRSSDLKGGPKPNYVQRGTSSCIFCGASDHKSWACTKFRSVEDRRKFFRDQDKCMNCGLSGHYTKSCTREGCKSCNGKKHHHTLCPSRQKVLRLNSPQQEQRKKGPNENPAKIETRQRAFSSGNQQSRKPTSAQAHSVDTEICAPERHGLQEPSQGTNPIALLSTSKNLETWGKEVAVHDGKNSVLLLTGVAKVKHPVTNQWKEVELLLDTGADESFIATELADQLGLVRNDQKELNVYSFGAEKPKHITSDLTTLEVWDMHGTKHTLRLRTAPRLMAVSKVAQLETRDLAFIAQRKIRLSKLEGEHISRPQILLGCDQLWTLLDVPDPRYKLPSGLQLIRSKLGYLLTGKQTREPTCTKREAKEPPTIVNSLVHFDEDLERWDKYWTMDSAGVCEFTGTKNAEKEAINAKVAAFFEDTIQKRPDGYYVRFPYKEDHPPLPTNRAIALKRLHSVIEFLKKTPALMEAYDKTFREQKEKGIIEEVPNAPCADGVVLHYIPHQPVITPHKETTKLRIVFDASAHFKESPSLNDVLHQGPLILPDLYAMLLRFRTPKYVIISDVEKAFLQIHLQEVDRDATRFLWVKDLTAPIDEDNITTLRFTRVTFGLNVSPYLLSGTIQHHLNNEVQDRDLAEEIRENLYVDNLVLSSRTERESREKSKKVHQIFKEIGMNLREFLSNDATLRDHLPKDSYANSTMHKVLGIPWDAQTDCLSISCPAPSIKTLTKRLVARQIASIYDPLGWLVALLMPAKKFQQDLWKQRFTWDEELPPTVCAQWNAITKNMDGFQKSFPRRFSGYSAPRNLAVFADASENAIAACAYIFNEVSSTLAMAKGKLPSIKSVTTMPKLEMNALTLAMRLALSVTQALESRITEDPWTIYVFSDSQIVLNWLGSSKTAGLGVLVTNRLREIRRIVHQLRQKGVMVTFAYVNTLDNPADAGTRGLSKAQLDNHIWWNGPSFLTKPVEEWDTTTYHLALNEDSSEDSAVDNKYPTVNAVASETPGITDILDWKHFSSFLVAKRVMAQVLRFIKRLIRPLDDMVKKRIFTNIPELKCSLNVTDHCSGTELRAARLSIIRNHQLVHLSHRYRKSMENTLRLYEDEHHLWRSKGRLGNALIEEEAKNPLFIAPNTPLAQLIIRASHEHYHSGIEHTISDVRMQYWVPKLRQQVRKVINSCVKCRRFNALPYHYPETSDLPSRRVVRCRPFQHTGLDFFDLPSCKENDKVVNLYGCIFTCTVTRLIHIEVVRSMTTGEFIHALRRFIARRGLPETITCDNAPTFLLAKDILNQAAPEINLDIRRYVTNQEIQWYNITPYAPWQGGFYERLIKSIKHAIYKILRGSNRRSLDDILTLSVEVEASLNSRPLTYQGAAHETMSSIRPVDFVYPEMTLTLPISEAIAVADHDPDYLPQEKRSFQYRQQVIESLHSSHQETERFWEIWRQQYLLALRETHRKNISNNRQGKANPDIGDIVLVCDPVLPRNDWKMGRITSVKRGTDGEIREAELLTSTKRKIRRPINLLVPLEIQEARSNGTQTPAHLEPTNVESTEYHQGDSDGRTHRYNLRKRKPFTYEHQAVTSSTMCTVRRSSPKWFLFHIMTILLIPAVSGNTTDSLRLTCGEKGVTIHATKPQHFEICADQMCKFQYVAGNSHLIKFPPEITLHDYEVLLKWDAGDHLAVIETTCKAIDFCENIDCRICASVLFNPECWPLGAILTLGVALYTIVALLYVLLYVPITIGKPIRIIFGSLKYLIVHSLACAGECCLRLIRRARRRNRATSISRFTVALAIAMTLILPETLVANACQDVDILEHQITKCTKSKLSEKCTVTLSEVLKLNTFKQEACLRLIKNSTSIANLKIRWKGLYLKCEQETLYFTRSTVLEVVDSKRCPTMGSCGDEKCASINTSTLIEELAEGNIYPGKTKCFESCGGFGCDCFYPSSGCLFYRIFARPRDSKVYEVFRCMRWTETTHLEILLEEVFTGRNSSHFFVDVHPNVPVSLPFMRITMTLLTLPPTPKLNSEFVTDGVETALLTQAVAPSLKCGSRLDAESLNCTFKENCICTPAEFKVLCECDDSDIAQEFGNIQQKLPIKTAYWELSKGKESPLTAKIPQMASSEIVINFHRAMDTAHVEISNHHCAVGDTTLKGCYRCAKGAVAMVRCTSEESTLGEILCAHHSFVIPCAPDGPKSVLHFQLDSARHHFECTITCGREKQGFKISGILKYVNYFDYPKYTMLDGNSTIYNEFEWPDLAHIKDVIFGWYKVLLVTVVTVALLLGLTYIFISTMGLRLFTGILCILKAVLCAPFRAVCAMLRFLKREPFTVHDQAKKRS